MDVLLIILSIWLVYCLQTGNRGGAIIFGAAAAVLCTVLLFV